jgi:hypothetical protein
MGIPESGKRPFGLWPRPHVGPWLSPLWVERNRIRFGVQTTTAPKRRSPPDDVEQVAASVAEIGGGAGAGPGPWDDNAR